MLGTPGPHGTWARERVVVIDDSFAPRVRRALRAHGQHSHELQRYGLGVLLVAMAVVALATRRAGPAVMAWSALVIGVPFAFVSWVGAVWLTVRRWTRHFARELAPGRMLGLTVGAHSIRLRDHDSANEYAYSTIKAVEVRHGVVLVRPGSALWVVPVELFAAVDLGLLQARAGRPGMAQVLLE